MYGGALLTTLQAEEWDLHGCGYRRGDICERTRLKVKNSPQVA
jgi:hypothetical protein